MVPSDLPLDGSGTTSGNGSGSPTGRPHSKRRRWAIPLSITLHVAVFLAIGTVPWAASDLPRPRVPLARVVWLTDQPKPSPEQSALEPTEATTVTDAAAPEPEVPVAPPRPSPEPAPERQRRARPVEPNPRPAPAPVPPATAPSSAANGPPAAASVPEVDWDKEREKAVHDVLEQRARQREYLTFSLDDLVKEPEPAEPVLPPLVVDSCVIVKGKLQRFAALMMGRCVREARGDLFALIKPAYLKAHPVCIETRPDSPGSFLSDGRQISTVKCELVAGDE